MDEKRLKSLYKDNLLIKQVMLFPFEEVVSTTNEIINFTSFLEKEAYELCKNNITWNSFFLPFKKIYRNLEFFNNYVFVSKDFLGNSYQKIENNENTKDWIKLPDIILDIKHRLANNNELVASFKELLKNETNPKKINILKNWLSVFFSTKLPQPQKKQYYKLNKLLDNRIKLFEKNENDNVSNTKSYIFIPTSQKYKLKGIDREVIAVGKYHAKLFNKDGWMFFYDEDTTRFIVSQAKNRALRKKVFNYYEQISRGDSSENNDNVLRDILSIKQQVAALHQKDNYAELVLSKYVLNTTRKAYQYLDDIEKQLIPMVKNIHQKITSKAHADGIKFVRNWDMEYYYNEMMKEEKNNNTINFDNYFEYNNFIGKFFKFLSKKFNLDIEEVKRETFDGKDLITYKIKDIVTLHEGFFVLSPFNNDVKTGPYQLSLSDNEKVGRCSTIPAVEYITLDIDNTGAENIKMSFYNVLVLLHEFGHALHAFYGNKEDTLFNESLSSWDLIELPSQYLEHLLYDVDFMQSMSCHIETGKKIPKTLLKQVIQSEQYFKAYDTYKDIQKFRAQLWLHENFKPFSKKSPSQIVAEKLGEKGLIYNVSKDSYMLYNSYLTDYAPTGYVYLYSAQIAAKLLEATNGNIKKVFTNVFNSDKMERLESRLSNIVDITDIDMISFLKKGWNINLYGDEAI